MVDLTIVGRKGSKAVAQIVKATSIKRYSANCDIVLNYGLAGRKMDSFLEKHQSAKKKPFINRLVGRSKYGAIKDAEAVGILVPETRLSITSDIKKDFLCKKMHSQGGKGIAMAETTGQREGWYYQKYLKERRYELRIHAFSWINEENWQVQKRIGNKDTIAWNFHNGGKFQTVHNPSGYQVFQKARSIAAKVLKMRKMAFGAVDLLLTKENKLYFLEINSAPGFTELSRPIYVNAFQALMKMKKTELELLTR